jgi:hypothetical protein
MRERSLGKGVSSTGSQNQRQSSVKLDVQSVRARATAGGAASLCASRKTVKARRMNIETSISEYVLTL